MPVPTRSPWRRRGAAVVAAGALTGGLLVAVPSTASAATPLPIATIQGTARFSPYVGKKVTTTPSVVTAAYPTGGLDGFVIQTPGTGGRKRSLTKASDAVFVYTGTSGVDVEVGDLVTVSGTVKEHPSSDDPGADSLTEIAGSVAVTKSDASYRKVKPVSGLRWASTYRHRENLESMLFSSTETWTVNDTYDLGTYGELGLATGGRLVQPTDKARLGSKAERKQARRNAERRVVLDDGLTTRFDKTSDRGTPPYITRSKDVRVGDTAKLKEPVVVDWRNGAWTFTPTHPTSAGHEVARLKRKTPEKAPKVKGDVSVASFNVLNYFTTLGSETEGCKPNPVSADGTPNTVSSGCDPRGAWDDADLARQQAKIVAAINGLDASVTGLMEIENSAKVDGPAHADEATSTLVDALNKAAGRAKWDYVPSSDQLQPLESQDVITNALIFQPAKVTWAGKAYADGKDAVDSGPFGNARTPIAATFTPVGGGAPMLVVVNHFKSKGGGSEATGDNVDQGEGAYNGDRIRQANALRAWVPSIQEDARTDAVALVGDFNSYTHEKPLETLYAAGWSNAAKQRDYSYTFDGLSGSLDHVLLNPAAKKRLTGSGVWNINSVEPVLREYSRYKSTAVDYYRANVYRASDHDPVKVGLKRGKAKEVTLQVLNFNDFHGRISKTSPDTKQFFGTIEQQRAAGGEGNTLLLSAGDNIGASLFNSSVQQDQPTIDVLNAADLDASAVGNHEFDRGFADLDGRVRDAADWTYLGANVYKKGTTTPVLPTYTIVKRAGLKIGVVGAVTQETSTLVSPAGIKDVEFGDPVTAVNRVAEQLTDGKKSNGEADVVVAEYHEGATKTQLDPISGQQVVSLEDQRKASPVFAHIVDDTSSKVAAIFTAHTHQAYAYDAPVPGVGGATRPVTQSGSYAAFLTKVTLTVDTRTKRVVAHTQQNLAPTKVPDADLAAAYPRVRRIAGIVDAALARADELGSVKIGEATHELTRAFGSDGEDTRAKESTLSDLVAEMYRASTASPERGSAQIGVQNPGGVRADLDEGDITFGEAASVLPFANSLFTVDLTGAQFTTLLEQQWQRDAAGNVPSRPYLQLGLSKNVTYTFDESLPEGSRITSVTVDGKAIDPAATYRVATNSFLASGGDNFRVFAEGANSKDTGLSDLDSWTDYIKAHTPISPSFAKQAVSVSPLPGSLTAGGTTTFTVSSLDFSSAPAKNGEYTGTDPATTTLTATLNGTEIGTFSASEGAATIALAVPADAAKGAGTLVLKGNTGTTVTIPVTVA